MRKKILQKIEIKKSTVSYLLISSVGFLLAIGFVAIASVSSGVSQEVFGTPYYYLSRHLIYIIIGLILGYAAFRVNLDLIRRYSPLFLVVNIFLLIAVSIIGFSAGGATRWLILGPVMIQPAEFIKLTFILYFSLWLSQMPEKRVRKKKKSSNKLAWGLLSCLAFLSISIFFLYNQPDASNLVILFLVAAILYFISGTPIWHSILAVALGIAGFLGLIIFAPYRTSRISVFLNPDLDPMGIGYQMKQVSIAIGSGGLFGLGLGMSKQKLGFLPEPMTDAIFAIFNEEAGFLGGALIVVLFIAFLWAGIMIAKNSSDKFSALVAGGITFWIIIQAFVNIGAMVRVFPLTGVALPFISYGGSHLVIEMIAVGILANIAKNKLEAK